jgi:hypothetical protein
MNCFSLFLLILIGFLAIFISIIQQETEFVQPELTLLLQKWKMRGEFVDIYGKKMFVVDSFKNKRAELELSPTQHKNLQTIILIHGYPSSSFDYHKVWTLLTSSTSNIDKRIITFDHIGFGFSEKPKSNFTYSLIEHCDNLVRLLKTLKVERNIHFVAHDMGDSILTEFLTRFQKGLLNFENVDNNNNNNNDNNEMNLFKSITFTNGGLFNRIILFFCCICEMRK